MSRRKQAKPRALKRELEENDGGTEDGDRPATMVTDAKTQQPPDTTDDQTSTSSDVPSKDTTGSTMPPETNSDDTDPHVASCPPTSSRHDVSKDDMEEDVDGVVGDVEDVDMEEEEQEEEREEEYRCDVCGDTFTSLNHFMDHRNFECSPDESCAWPSITRRVGRVGTSGSGGGGGADSPASLQSRTSASPTTSATSVDVDASTSGCKSPLTDSPLSPTAAGIAVDLLPFSVGVSEGHPYACQFCEKAFGRLSFLKKHEQVHGDLMPFRCEFCHRLFKHKRSRDRHLKLHTGDRKYRCPHCNSAFSRSDHLKIHLKTHDQARPYQCPACSRGFSTAAALTAHALTHTKPPPPGSSPASSSVNGDDPGYQCGICHDRFTLEQDLQAHVLQVHDVAGSSPTPPPGLGGTGGGQQLVEKVYQCEQCQEVYIGRAALEAHIKEVHSSGLNFRRSCPICDAFFTNTDDLLNHIRRHSDMSPHNNNNNSKPNFHHKGQEHKSTSHHSVAKKRKVASSTSASDNRRDCPYCSKSGFPSQEVLEIHVRSMHMEKTSQMHVCQYCNAAYPTLNDLEDHIKIIHHTSLGIKFSCEFCTLEFSQFADLKAHLDKVHKYAEFCGSDVDIVFCSQCTMGFPNAFALSEHVHNAHSLPIPLKNGPISPGIVLKKEKTSRPPSVSSNGTAGGKVYPEAFSSPMSSSHVAGADRTPTRPVRTDSSTSGGLMCGTSINGELTAYTCAECNATFLDVKSYQAHLNSHLTHAGGVATGGNSLSSSSPNGSGGGGGGGGKNYSCAECASEFSSEDQLENHVYVHFLALTTEYGCTSCLKLFSKPDELQKHLMDIHAHHLYRCSLCKEIFDSKVNIQVHFAIKHSNECKLYKCMPCGSVFRSEMEWQLHVKVHHLGMSKPYRCLFCKESFCTEVELQCHLTTHKKQFACPLCEEAFHVEYLLDKHIQTKHTPEEQSASAASIPTHNGPLMKPKEEVKEAEILDYSMSGPSANNNNASSRTSTPNQCSPKSSRSPPSLLHNALSTNLPPLLTQTQQRPMSPAHVHNNSGSSNHHTTNNGSSVNSPPSPALQPPMPITMRKGDLNYKCDICDVKFSEDAALQKHRLHDHSISPEMSLALAKAQQAAAAAAAAAAVVSEQQQHQQQQQHQTQPQNESTLHSGQRSSSSSNADSHQGNAQSQAQVSPKSSSHSGSGTSGSSNNTSGVDKFSQLCVYCNKTFKTKGELEKHMKSHASPSNQKCNICDEVFPSASILAEHKLTHCKVVKGNVCTVCKVAMKNEEQFYAHAQQHGFQGTNMQCIVCRQTLASMLELQMHGKHHFQAPAAFYTCCVCLASFDSKENLIAKLNSSGRTYYVCKPCYHGDLMAAAAAAGVTAVTAGVVEFRCPTCNVKFETQASLEAHMSTHKKTYQCIKCQQSFASEYEIQMHVATHVMQEGNVHDCRICGTVFDSPAKLQCHLIEHTFEGGEIKCYVCNALFTHASAVQMHVLEHGLGARRYACPQCPQSFFFSAELQNHLLSTHHAPNAAHHLSSTSSSSTRPPSSSTASSSSPQLQQAATPSQAAQPLELQCPECPKNFTSLLALGAHRKVHEKKQRHTPSPHPSSRSGTPGSVHSLQVAAAEETLKCSLCPEVFHNIGDLQQHFLSLHAAEAELLQRKGQALSMAAIETGSESGSGMTGPPMHHTSSHHDVTSLRKVYQCGECGKECHSLSHLQSHSKVHSSGKENRKAAAKVSNKPFPCPICGRTFTRKTHLKDHMKVHLQNVQPSSYACEYCSDTFPNTKLLRRHLVSVHNSSSAADHVTMATSPSASPTRPQSQSPDLHTCRVCGDSFPHGRHLATHLQQVHGVTIATADDLSSSKRDTGHHKAEVDDKGEICAPNATGEQTTLVGVTSSPSNSRSPDHAVAENGYRKESDSSEGKGIAKLLSSNSGDSNSNFVGVTVVANPSEQVTVS